MMTHFAFGENWASYAAGIGAPQIEWSERCMRALLGENGVRGRRLVDIGCGSGLHSAAALRLGAASVVALDRAPPRVATPRLVLERLAPPGATYQVRQADILSLDPAAVGRFDLVYSWGVLHHTGAMHHAIERAASLVEPGGRFAF